MGKSTPKVYLANGDFFQSRADSTILDGAVSGGVAIEYSCRNGRCGVCKAKVISGHTKLLSVEACLESRDINSGYILTCCRAAVSDLQLDIASIENLPKFESKITPARIDQINKRSDDVVEIVFRLPPTGRLQFRSGQYVDVIGPANVRRSYSIANAPRDDGKLSLQIRKVEGGKLSQYWFTEAKLNDLVRLEGPFGTFFLRDKPEKRLILLATGTGIAPLKAILEEISRCAGYGVLEYSEISLYWGGRTRQDIYWTPEFGELPLKFIPVISGANQCDERTGYVQNAVLEDGIDLRGASVYACGSDKMIRSAREKLVAAGLNSNMFYSETFVSSN